MKLPTWFSSTKKAAAAPPTTAELATKVAEAQEAHTAALSRVEAARAELAANRTESAAQALREAKAEVGDVEEMLAILSADHAAAVGRDSEAELARLNAEADAMELELSPERIDSEERLLLEQEIAAWSRLLEIRDRRKAHCEGHEERVAAYVRLCTTLGREPNSTRNHVGLDVPVRAALKEMAQTATGYRRRFIEHLGRIPAL